MAFSTTRRAQARPLALQLVQARYWILPDLRLAGRGTVRRLHHDDPRRLPSDESVKEPLEGMDRDRALTAAPSNTGSLRYNHTIGQP
jgi:hypothetical protein